MNKDAREALKEIFVTVLSEDEELRKFVKAFLKVYGETSK